MHENVEEICIVNDLRGTFYHVESYETLGSSALTQALGLNSVWRARWSYKWRHVLHGTRYQSHG